MVAGTQEPSSVWKKSTITAGVSALVGLAVFASTWLPGSGVSLFLFASLLYVGQIISFLLFLLPAPDGLKRWLAWPLLVLGTSWLVMMTVVMFFYAPGIV